ncbi:putative addiction module antidote protein [Candidatus Magnetomoraceae bacterium gMMP-1]
MATKTTPYNPFDYLESKEEINEYLNNAFMDDDPRVFIIALGYLAKKKGMAQVAKKTGLNRESLYKSLSGDGNPAFATIKKITKGLGIHLVAQPAHTY